MKSEGSNQNHTCHCCRRFLSQSRSEIRVSKHNEQQQKIYSFGSQSRSEIRVSKLLRGEYKDALKCLNPVLKSGCPNANAPASAGD